MMIPVLPSTAVEVPYTAPEQLPLVVWSMNAPLPGTIWSGTVPPENDQNSIGDACGKLKLTVPKVTVRAVKLMLEALMLMLPSWFEEFVGVVPKPVSNSENE